MMKKIRIIVSLPATLLLATSCSPISNYTHNPETKSGSTETTNIVKVLNRVQCHESHIGTCMQSDFNGIWELCLQNGFRTETPNSKIISGRDLKEFVSGSIVRTMERTTTIQKTDENGIVTEVQSKPKSVQVSMFYKGYCIGSEYITNT